MFDDYDKIDALNWSTLKVIKESPAKLKHMADHPEELEDKDDYRLGRATHCAILEPDKFDDSFIVKPDFGNLNSKDGISAKIAFLELIIPDGSHVPIGPDGDKMADLREYAAKLEAATSGIEVISHSQRDAALRAADAVRKHKEARDLLEGTRREETITWTDPDTGIKCKGRVDAVSNRIIDIKKTRKDSLRTINRQAAELDYHGQVSWYHDGAVRSGLISGHVLPAVIFIHIPAKGTFVDVVVFNMGLRPETLEDGRALYRGLINEYAGCQLSGQWPGMAPRSIPWELPAWKLEE